MGEIDNLIGSIRKETERLAEIVTEQAARLIAMSDILDYREKELQECVTHLCEKCGPCVSGDDCTKCKWLPIRQGWER